MTLFCVGLKSCNHFSAVFSLDIEREFNVKAHNQVSLATLVIPLKFLLRVNYYVASLGFGQTFARNSDLCLGRYEGRRCDWEGTLVESPDFERTHFKGLNQSDFLGEHEVVSSSAVVFFRNLFEVHDQIRQSAGKCLVSFAFKS